VDETQYQHPIVQLKQPQVDGEPRELMRLRTAT
jgi:hypothetical protein